MELHLKITAGLLLIVHAFHLASLQDPTSSSGGTTDERWLGEDEPTPTSALGRTIDKSWLRDISRKNVGSAASGAEDENLLNNEGSANDTSDDLNVVNTSLPPTFPNDTAQEFELVDTTFSPSTTNPNTTTMMTNSDQQLNMTETEEESQNSTATPQKPTTPQISGNHSSFPDLDNDTDIKSTIPSPESNATQETTAQPEDHTGLSNSTGSTSTPTTTEKTPDINETSNRPSPTTMFPRPSSTTVFPRSPSTTVSPGPSPTTVLPRPSSTTVFPRPSSTTVFPGPSPTAVFPVEPTVPDPATTTATASDTLEKADKMDKGAASGSSSERGLASDPQRSGRNVQWGAVLGTAVVVAIVGLVAYFIMRRKRQKAFSHQKLVEEYHADPVLRLDNSEPLDLNFGGAAYYNPGLQGDNIQMTNFPGRHNN